MKESFCPICGKAMKARWRPFCSSRCADIDLHRWLSGGYSIAGDEDEQDGGEDRFPGPSDETKPSA